jgi:hypothetical protein
MKSDDLVKRLRIAGDLRIVDPHPIAFLIGWGVLTERLVTQL